METISLKLDEEMLFSIDGNLKKHHYGTRTEFIREAIRDKLKEMSDWERIEDFLALRGKAGKKTTDKERQKAKEHVSRELKAYLDKKFNQ